MNNVAQNGKGKRRACDIAGAGRPLTTTCSQRVFGEQAGGAARNPEVVELPLLVTVRQLAALDSIASRQGTTVGRFVRQLIWGCVGGATSTRSPCTLTSRPTVSKPGRGAEGLAQRGVDHDHALGPGEFAAQVGHELRGPLGAIRNALAVLHQHGDDTVVWAWAKGVLDRQTQQMSRLVEDLLSLSGASHGKVRLRMQSVDVADIVREVVETVRPCIEERRHRLDVALPAAPLNLEADPIRLLQVLTNLLTNAAKYTEPGGWIGLSVVREGNDVVLRVRDTGVGVEPELLPHLFEPFWQSPHEAAHAAGGLGIGLALVRQLVEMHGGDVRAFSDGPGRGSEFVVRLPQAAVTAKRATQCVEG